MLALCIAVFFCCPVSAQMQQVHLDVAGNDIKKISFYSPASGYVAFTNWIGFTADSGRTFTQKFITNNNINYNGYTVNIPSGVITTKAGDIAFVKFAKLQVGIIDVFCKK